MASVKKNFAYNSFLSVSGYLINLVLFPYCTRIFGVELFGTLNFTQNIVQYFLFFASMGITHIGVREIAKQTNKEDLSKCYSSMLVLNIIYTLFALVVYLPLIFYINKFAAQKELFLLGGFQILFTTFTIEWFFRGIEDFKYITIRSLVIKILYAISVFLFIKTPDDYTLYFALTVAITVVNAFVNFIYSKRFINFSFFNLDLKKYLRSSLSLGAYSILTSMYTTFNVVFLGFVWNDIQVGYYTTAIKLYIIILGFYSAFTGVMLPRMTALLKDDNKEAYNAMISKSLELLYTVAIPLVFYMFAMAPEIIFFLAGEEFMPAANLSRIVIPMLFVVGVAQVLNFQVLIPKGYDRVALLASIIGAVVGVSLNIILTFKFSSTGTCITVVITEMCVTSYYIYVVLKNKLIQINTKFFLLHFVWSLPYLLICYMSKLALSNSYWFSLISASFCCLVYFAISQKYFIKNQLLLYILPQWNR